MAPRTAPGGTACVGSRSPILMPCISSICRLMRSNLRLRQSHGVSRSFSSETPLGISSSLLNASPRQMPVPNKEGDRRAKLMKEATSCISGLHASSSQNVLGSRNSPPSVCRIESLRFTPDSHTHGSVSYDIEVNYYEVRR